MSYIMDFEDWYKKNLSDIEEDFIEQHQEALYVYARKVYDEDPEFYKE